jgi:uncharacterized membrane protein (UPF0136 family)
MISNYISNSMFVWAVGALVAFFGVFGAMKTGSVMSGVAGVSVGLGYLYSGYVMKFLGNPVLGKRIAIIVSTILLAVGVWRLVKTGKFMPAGMLIIIGGVTSAVEVFSLLN